MKNVFTTTVTVLSAAIFIASCGGATTKSTGDATADKPAKEAVAANPGKMSDFMAMLDGTEGSAQKAVDAYFSDDLKNNQAAANELTFTNFTMKDAKVVSVEGQCCTMEAKAGVTTRSFKLCWQGDKVTSIEDLGVK